MTGIRVVWMIAAATIALALTTPAKADSTTCQETIAKQLQKYKKTYLKAHTKCLRLENLGHIGGPCPDLSSQDKVDQTTLSVTASIAAACSLGDASSLGFAGDCALEAGASGAARGGMRGHVPVDHYPRAVRSMPRVLESRRDGGVRGDPLSDVP